MASVTLMPPALVIIISDTDMSSATLPVKPKRTAGYLSRSFIPCIFSYTVLLCPQTVITCISVLHEFRERSISPMGPTPKPPLIIKMVFLFLSRPYFFLRALTSISVQNSSVVGMPVASIILLGISLLASSSAAESDPTKYLSTSFDSQQLCGP